MAAESDLDVAKPRWQWSLKQLLYLTALLAGFAAILGYMGFSNEFYWVCAIASALLVLVYTASLPYRSFTTPMWFTLVVMFFTVNPCALFSFVMLCNCCMHLLLNNNSRIRTDKIEPVQTLLTSLTLTLIAFFLGVLPGISGYLEFVELEKELQPVSLAHRLEYENLAEGRKPSISISTTVNPGAYAAYELEELISATENIFGRHGALRHLHNGTAEMFAKSPGFGVMRMPIPSPERARTPKIRNIDFAGNASNVVQENDPYSLEPLPIYSWRSHEVFSSPISSHSQFHQTGIIDFLLPDTWGYIIEPKIAIGFNAHDFHFPLQSYGNDYLQREGLQLASLQLVSLLKFDSPLAYDLDHLPRMDQLNTKDPPTRALSELERKLLNQLLDDETKQIAVDESPTEVKMLGTIRAFEACLDCHAGPKNAILGAFTYRFTRIEK